MFNVMSRKERLGRQQGPTNRGFKLDRDGAMERAAAGRLITIEP